MPIVSSLKYDDAGSQDQKTAPAQEAPHPSLFAGSEHAFTSDSNKIRNLSNLYARTSDHSSEAPD